MTPGLPSPDPATPKKVPPERHFIVFLPFLRLKNSCTVGGVDFLPLRDSTGKVPQLLELAAEAIDMILTGYTDREGNRFTNCVVATLPGKGWDLARDDYGQVLSAVSLLFLGSWACNEYFPRFGGAYVNSSDFRVVGQSYSGPLPEYISISARRRDGGTLDGGYKHGEVMFNLPVQCSIRESATVDEAFLKAVDVATAAGADIIGRLSTAIRFVELANTDDDFMSDLAEAILMGSAFEQLLNGDASSYKLGKKLGCLFSGFGGVTVADAKTLRPGIQIDTSKPEYAAAQPKWWVHRKWMEELYDVRSKVVHEGNEAARPWGWTVFEHLVMAAHVFPMAVKLLLAQDGYYTLTEADRVRCLVVDKLLAAATWAGDRNHDESKPSWSGIVGETQRNESFQRRKKAFLAENPAFFDDEKGSR